jgi:nucleolar protein 4
VTETELRDAFKDAAFVWDVLMPLSADKKSKGFAFVTFTCRADAELAIAKVNGTEVRA